MKRIQRRAAPQVHAGKGHQRPIDLLQNAALMTIWALMKRLGAPESHASSVSAGKLSSDNGRVDSLSAV